MTDQWTYADSLMPLQRQVHSNLYMKDSPLGGVGSCAAVPDDNGAYTTIQRALLRQHVRAGANESPFADMSSVKVSHLP